MSHKISSPWYFFPPVLLTSYKNENILLTQVRIFFNEITKLKIINRIKSTRRILDNQISKFNKGPEEVPK